MKLHYFGDKKQKKIIILHPFCLDASCMQDIFYESFKNYFLIIPDISNHGDDQNTYYSASKEADTIIKFLINENIEEIDLIIGISEGGIIASKVIKNDSIKFLNVILDSLPLADEIIPKFILTSIQSSRLILKNRISKIKKLPLNQTIKLEQNKFKNLYGKYANKARENYLKLTSHSIYKIIKDKNSFDFYKYKEELQKNIVFVYGNKSLYADYIDLLKDNYKFAKFKTYENLDHIELLIKNQNDYIKLVKEILEKSHN